MVSVSPSSRGFSPASTEDDDGLLSKWPGEGKALRPAGPTQLPATGKITGFLGCCGEGVRTLHDDELGSEVTAEWERTLLTGVSIFPGNDFY